jgi:hypothetical protein
MKITIIKFDNSWHHLNNQKGIHELKILIIKGQTFYLGFSESKVLLIKGQTFYVLFSESSFLRSKIEFVSINLLILFGYQFKIKQRKLYTSINEKVDWNSMKGVMTL